MSKILRIALLQLTSHKNDQKANLLKGEKFCRMAKELRADIVLFPEMWNIGYIPFSEDILHRDYTPQDALTYEKNIEEWKAQAISMDSNFIQHFIKLAKELNIAIAISFLEKFKDYPRNSVSLIDRNGDIQFTYAKVHTCDFSAEAICTSGEDFYVSDLDTEKGNVKVGTMICFDREFPESARVLMLKGAELILVPNACEMEANRIHQFQSRAFENMVGVALANYAAPEQNGHSCAFDGIVFNNDGTSRDSCRMMADHKEGIFIAEFDLDKIREWRRCEVWGNAYRKPKTYQSLVKAEIEKPFLREKN